MFLDATTHVHVSNFVTEHLSNVDVMMLRVNSILYYNVLVLATPCPHLVNLSMLLLIYYHSSFSWIIMSWSL